MEYHHFADALLFLPLGVVMALVWPFKESDLLRAVGW